MRNLLLAGVALLVFPAFGAAQTLDNVLVSNRLEYSRSAEDQADQLRNWLDADFWAQRVRFGFRLETVQTPLAQTSRSEISQRFVEVRQGDLRMRFGNFYEKIGQGLLFQTFELRALVLDRIERSFVQDRNGDGVWLEYQGPRLEGRLFSARPLDPRTGTRENVVRGADANVWLTGRLKVGGSAMRWYAPGWMQLDSPLDYGAGRAQWLGSVLGVSAEYAWRSAGPWARGAGAHAFYGSISAALPSVALSLQWKDYRDFALPFNNPPPLVPTHSVALLNRHTHLLLPQDERGYQAQITWTPSPGWSVVALANRGSNHHNSPYSRYHEVFLDLRYEELGRWNGRVILDDASDRTFGREKVRTAALELERSFSAVWSAFVDWQIQKVRMVGGETYWNQLLTLNLAHASAYSVAVQVDRTTQQTEKRKVLPALILSGTLNGQHQLVLTIGSRRAGLLCSGGVCAFVPEFRGVELRLNSRF